MPPYGRCRCRMRRRPSPSNFSSNGQSFALTWQLGGGASLDCTVLPVELTSFAAEARSNSVDLQWITASEHDNDRFEVERSTDGASFTAIGVVPGAGNSNQTTKYGYTDASPLEGLSYYRLRQVDIDGVYSFSNVESVVFRRNGTGLLVFPNPGNDHMEVVVGGDLTGGTIGLFDPTGREVSRAPINDARISMATGALPLGIYSVRVSLPDGSWQVHGTWVKR